MAIREPAPAKINLALHVRRRRADGYHDLETLFAFCADGDSVTVARAETDRFDLTGPFAADLRRDPEIHVASAKDCADNLVVRAARAFGKAVSADVPHAITLDKHLPVASGIGGGSADAAATLRALARMYDVPPDAPEVVAIARDLGADVPACLAGRTALGRGRGDRLEPAGSVAGLPVLLVNPRVAVSTGAVFAAWDGVDRGPLRTGDPIAIAMAGRNDLAAPACGLAPVIGDVLAELARQPGADLVRMSGSGATCFAIFGDTAARDAAQARLSRFGWWQLGTILT